MKKNSTLYDSLSNCVKNRIANEFQNRIRTEELKAWYGSPEGDSIFQGTSISSLTIGARYNDPLILNDINSLEIEIAKRYIEEHDRLRKSAKDAIIEDTQEWIEKGLPESTTFISPFYEWNRKKKGFKKPVPMVSNINVNHLWEIRPKKDSNEKDKK